MFKAVHKESGQLLAIKQVPVDSDLQDIIKEISIMQQCDRYAADISTPVDQPARHCIEIFVPTFMLEASLKGI